MEEWRGFDKWKVLMEMISNLGAEVGRGWKRCTKVDRKDLAISAEGGRWK